MEILLFVLLIFLMLLGFLLYTAVAATFFFTVPLIFKEIRRRHRETGEAPPASPPR
jgi:hypothetical protein